jgi:hypothetical protein
VTCLVSREGTYCSHQLSTVRFSQHVVWIIPASDSHHFDCWSEQVGHTGQVKEVQDISIIRVTALQALDGTLGTHQSATTTVVPPSTTHTRILLHWARRCGGPGAITSGLGLVLHSSSVSVQFHHFTPISSTNNRSTCLAEPSDANCVSWAASALSDGDCDSAPDAGVCSVDCALNVLRIARRCTHLEDLFPSGLVTACEILSATMLGTPPRASIHVQPMHCQEHCTCNSDDCSCDHGYHAQADLHGCTADLQDSDCGSLVPNSMINSDGMCICAADYSWIDSECVPSTDCLFAADGCEFQQLTSTVTAVYFHCKRLD